MHRAASTPDLCNTAAAATTDLAHQPCPPHGTTTPPPKNCATHFFVRVTLAVLTVILDELCAQVESACDRGVKACDRGVEGEALKLSAFRSTDEQDDVAVAAARRVGGGGREGGG